MARDMFRGAMSLKSLRTTALDNSFVLPMVATLECDCVDRLSFIQLHNDVTS